MKWNHGWIVLLGVLVGPGCGGDEGVENSVEIVDAANSSESSELRVATYNAGIAEQFVSYASERVVPIADALAEVEADVLCLQEVYSDESLAAFIEGAKETFPHAYYEVTEEDLSDAEPSCTADEVIPLQECIELNCAETDNLSDCGTTHCISEFTALPPTCQGCVASNLGLGVEGILSACVSSGASLAYGGSNGLLLLSRMEIINPMFTILPSFQVQRGWISAEIGDLSVACTHLATPLATTYDGEFDSYAAEQTAQIELVLGALEAVEGPLVLLGDLNTGPGTGNLNAELEDNWELFGSAGFTSSNTEQETPFCTWCADNTLIDSETNLAIDHILARNVEVSDVVRFLDGTVDIQVGDESITTSYSDHYGLTATVLLP